MKIYNSLSREIEDFIPQKEDTISMYTCGPTVYSFPTIGNFRTYVTSDLLLRTLKFLGYNVNFVMNLTDVGHLSGDNEGDADTGEDRLQKSAEKEGKTAWEIAEFYTQSFLKDFAVLNLTKPKVFAKATDHIPDQVSLVKALMDKGFAYKIKDGVYFDTKLFEKNTGKKYGELSNLHEIKEGARVEPNPDKKDPRDFALWKFSYPGGRKYNPTKDDPKKRRHMEWSSPWGLGFPGWHIECSAMSMKYLGETLDIHVGGEDLRSTHHPNEIAQSEGATGQTFVKYWVHSAFLKVDGKRMGKSLGNAYTVSDLAAKGFGPLSLRYFYLTGHYRQPLNFTWEGLASAQIALEKLNALFDNEEVSPRTILSQEKLEKIANFRQSFREAITSDLNLPKALSVVWEVAKSNIPKIDKQELLVSFDEVLGLSLGQSRNPWLTPSELPINVLDLVHKREAARTGGDYKTADEIRVQLDKIGFELSDSKDGPKVRKKLSGQAI